MRVTCPHCGHKAELMHLVKGEVEMRWAYLLGQFPKADLPTIQGFLDCFRKPSGVLGISRQANILAELRQIIETGRVDFERRTFEGATYPIVIKAMEETFRLKDRAGLPNLNYFKRILTETLKRADAQNKRETEEARRTRPGRSSEPSRVVPEWVKEKINNKFRDTEEEEGGD